MRFTYSTSCWKQIDQQIALIFDRQSMYLYNITEDKIILFIGSFECRGFNYRRRIDIILKF